MYLIYYMPLHSHRTIQKKIFILWDRNWKKYLLYFIMDFGYRGRYRYALI